MKFQIFKNITSVIFLATLFLGCGQKKEEQATPAASIPDVSTVVQLTDAQYKNAGITTDLPKKLTIGHVVILNGKTEVMPENNITVSTPMSGIVRQLKIMPGMSVQKGQALLKLEDKEFIQLQQDYLSAKNALAYAKIDFERQSELTKNKAASDKTLQSAEEKLRQQQIMVTSLAEKLKLININPASLTPENMTSQMVIYAPASGSITDVMANQGKYMQAGENLLQMSAFEGTKIVLKAFEKDLPFIKTGQKMIAYTNAAPDKKITGKIEYIVNQVNQEGFSEVICKLDSRPQDLMPGMYVNAEVEALSMESWTVPDESIIRFEGKDYVFIKKDELVFEMTEVQAGQKENGRTQILNAESIMNQQVIHKGAYTLLMKMKNVSDE